MTFGTFVNKTWGKSSFLLVEGLPGTEGERGGDAGSGGCAGLGGYAGEIAIKGVTIWKIGGMFEKRK